MEIASFSKTSAWSLLIAPLQAILAPLSSRSPALATLSLHSQKLFEAQKITLVFKRPGRCRTESQRVFVPNSQLVATLDSVQQTALPPLKITKQIEMLDNRCFVRRMVISGRMFDVCAELDRLAQQGETQ